MITDLLKVTLANHVEGMNMVMGMHWNIEGTDFLQYHQFFAEVEADLYSQLDTIGEYIRIVSNGSDYINMSMDVLKTNKTFDQELIIGSKWKDMFLEIKRLNDALIQDYTKIFELATKNDHQDIANYAADRINTLNKNNWKIISTVK